MKTVVIIGGGFAGALAAKKLESNFNVSLFDTKDYFEFTPSVLRTLVEPQHAKKIQVCYKDFLKKASFYKEKVTSLSIHEAKTHKRKASFDYAIVCSGSTYASPIKESGLVIASRAKELIQIAENLRKAKKILIIGGGLVGVELAAEICTHFSDKNVMIAHSGKELIDRNPVKARKYAQAFLEKRGVAISWDTFIKEKKGKTFIAENGASLAPDLAFLCTGFAPSNSFLKKIFSSCLDQRGFLMVNEFLQVENNPSIFAAGDIVAIREEKTAQTAEKHAKLIVENIMRLERGKPLIAYHPKQLPMVISLGKYDGILVKKDFVITGLLPGLLKHLVERKAMWKYRALL